MRRRILVAILSVTAVAVVLFGLPLAVVVEWVVDDEATLRVERQAVLAARDVPSGFAASGDPVELDDGRDGIALALYDPAGRLVTGTGPATADEPTGGALNGRIVDLETSDALVVAVPVSANEQVVGAIRAERSTAVTNARTWRIIGLLAALAVAVLAIGAAIGYGVAGRLARPVRRLRDAAVQLGDGDFAIDMPRSRIPELDDAARAMTSTARRLDDLQRRERAFSSDASHQLRTPLAGLRTAIETEIQFPRTDTTAVLHEALTDLDRLEGTITELLALARTPATAPATISVPDVLADVAAAWHGRLAAAGRPLIVADARDAPAVRGNPTMLRHALDVLVDNAVTHGAGEVRIDHTTGADAVTISVTDEGAGFPADSTDHTETSPASRAPVHGFGLPLARRLVDSMPGRLIVSHRGSHPCVDIVLSRTDTTPPVDSTP